MRRLLHLAAMSALLLAGGCATIDHHDPRDPLEPYNREMTRFNEGLDSVLLKPVATAYRDGVPPLVRTGVSNFFGNLSDAWSAVNSLLQFRFQNAEENLARFQINTVAGVFGLFDVASDLNIERHREDFGQTLGRWGVPAGPYLVLPVLGPSTMRDALVIPIERYGDLTRKAPTAATQNELFLLRAIDVRANLLRVGNIIEGAALDKYSFTRDAFLQKRRAEIFDFRKEDPTAGQIDDRRPGKDGQLPNDGQIPLEDDPAPAAKPGQPASAPAR